jgi:signal transduction histidine kinase
LIATGGIALLDWWTGVDINPEIFYVIPVAAAAWLSGKGPAVALSAAAATGWFVADVVGGHGYGIAVWNAGGGLAVLLTVALALATVRRYLDERSRLVGGLRASLRVQGEAKEDLFKSSSELARSNAELEQYAYVAAHDLKSPLVAVGGFVQLAKRHLGPDPDPKAALCLDEAMGGVRRMEALIDDLLAYSKAGAGAEPRGPTDTTAMLQEVLATLRAEIEERGGQVSFEPLPWVVARPREVVQLFQNLVGNALKFLGSDPPHVHIGIERIGQEQVFFVRDNGPGIAPADAQRVFGLFQRLPGATQTPGTGIGLAVCKKIVESLGGRIWVDSKPGEGATFRFTLPLVEQR